MLADVLAALGETEGVTDTILVTRERQVAPAACAARATIVWDEREAGESSAVMLGILAAVRRGFDRVVCVPGDCPALDPRELSELLEMQQRDGLAAVVVPDRHGTGTNGLMVCPPDAIEPGFGIESCARHCARARRAGIYCRVEQLPSLLLDVDTSSDVAALHSRLSVGENRGPRTRLLLAELADAPFGLG
jgi:2-phospho-L-lactate guanylyltransferase